MDWQLTSLIVGMFVAVLGGLTGFLSVLLPLWRERTNLEIIIPHDFGVLYRDEIYEDRFNIDSFKSETYVDFPVVLSTDLCIINKSNRNLIVYSIRLTCNDESNTENEYFMSQIRETTKGRNPFPFYVRETYCELPLRIDSNSAELVSVKFLLGDVDKISNFNVHVYCQGKAFNTELPIKDYSNIERYIKEL